MRQLWSRAIGFVKGRRRDRELDDEVKFHLEMLIDRYVLGGMSVRDARAAALREFGGVAQMKEAYRDQRSLPWLETWVQDVRYGARMLRRTPGVTVAALLSLALGIGANTAIFSLIDAVMLRSLPVRDPGSLIEVLTETKGGAFNAFSYQALRHFREETSTLEAVVASHSTPLFVIGEDRTPERAAGQYVTGNFFDVLGVGPSAGRALHSADDHPDAATVTVLSHSYWRRRFGGTPDVVGRTLSIEDHLFTIVGVATAGFSGMAIGKNVDLWLPLAAEPLLRKKSFTSSAGYKWLQVLGRLKPGVGVERARAEFETLFQHGVIDVEVALRPDAASQRDIRSWRPLIEAAGPGLSGLRRQYAEPLFVLLGVSGAVLLIACVNVANLLSARAAARRHEMAVRLSLGATRLRVMRQLLTESVMLAAAGGMLGVVFAYAGCQYLLAFFTTSRSPITLLVTPDLRVLAFTAALSLATGLLFGLAPAWRTTGERDRSVSGTRVRISASEGRGLSRWLIGGQVSLSLVMLVCAGLLVRSLQNLRAIDIGFDRESVLLLDTDVSHSGLGPEARRAAFRETLRRLEALPGVQAASLCWIAPIAGGGTMRNVSVAGPGASSEPMRNVHINWVSPNYFAALRTPILSGRDFRWSDSLSSPAVAIVNQTLARRYFPGGDPIGRQIALDGGTYEIIAVTRDAKYLEVRDSTPPTIYFDFFQQKEPSGQFAIRTAAGPARLADTARREIRAVAPTLAVTKAWTLAEQVDASIVRERMLGTLSAFFAALGLLLAAVGLYGVMAYTVTRRTGEIGIRIALGAQSGGIARLVLREVLLLTMGGVAIGIATSLVITRNLTSLLFGLEPSDPTTIAGAALLMITTAVAAAYFPSRRAARMNPVDALRSE
jgi:predicted permease